MNSEEMTMQSIGTSKSANKIERSFDFTKALIIHKNSLTNISHSTVLLLCLFVTSSD